MKFLVDECCSVHLVEELRTARHDVCYVLEEMPGATDTEVLEKSKREDRILLTEDKDFGELVYRLKKEVTGIILLHFPISKRHLTWPRLDELITIKGSNLKEKFVVVDEQKFRIRPL